MAFHSDVVTFLKSNVPFFVLTQKSIQSWTIGASSWGALVRTGAHEQVIFRAAARFFRLHAKNCPPPLALHVIECGLRLAGTFKN